jgi:hypothetical protein
MAFALFHASQMPRVRAGAATAKRLGPELFEVDAVFENAGMIPTRTQRAVDKRIGAPDRASVAPAGFEAEIAVVSGGVVDPATNAVASPDVRRPADLRVAQGIDGDGSIRLRWLVRGHGAATITYRAEKGGSAQATVQLR